MPQRGGGRKQDAITVRRRFDSVLRSTSLLCGEGPLACAHGPTTSLWYVMRIQQQYLGVCLDPEAPLGSWLFPRLAAVLSRPGLPSACPIMARRARGIMPYSGATIERSGPGHRQGSNLPAPQRRCSGGDAANISRSNAAPDRPLDGDGYMLRVPSLCALRHVASVCRALELGRRCYAARNGDVSCLGLASARRTLVYRLRAFLLPLRHWR